MTGASVCCKDMESFPSAKSPFSKMIAIGFYDGPTSGIVQCEVCAAAYKFLMIDWDDRQEIRVFSLALLPAQSLQEVVNMLSPYEPSHWPVWVPKWQFPSEEIRNSVDREIKNILATADLPILIVAWTRYGERILKAKRVESRNINDIQDWFSSEDHKSNRDWFNYLGLTR